MLSFWRKNKGSNKGVQQRGGLYVSKQALQSGKLSSEFILSTIEDGVVMVGSDNTVHLFNPAASNITGWPAAEAGGLDFHSVLNLTDDRGKSYLPQDHPFAKALNQHTTVRDSKSLLSTRSGKLLPISLIVSPVAEAGQAIDSVVGVFRDITAEKLEESKRSEFISTASHEMRTPIAAIEGYIALALNPKVVSIDPRAKNYLQKAHDATQHLGQLFQDLLTSSKAEDGRLASYPKVVELGEIVEQIAEGARFAAQKKDLQLRYVVSRNKELAEGHVVRPLFYVNVDPNRIREVLQNIVDNAVKYTLEGGITISLTGDNAVVQVQVQDSGPGIPEEDIPHLFQKFYRVDNSMTRNVGGTGLGLFISRKIVEMYNGRIWAESQLSKGSTFFINLPRLSAEQALQMQKQQASMASPLDTH